MTHAYPPLPSRDDLLALFHAAIANANDLLSDAQVLAEAGRFPRAFALATLAWEELSKAQLCVLTVTLPEITPDYFWEGFRDHEGKLSRVSAHAAFMAPAPIPSIDAYAKAAVSRSKSMAKQKMRGLYVDYRRGKILLPSQIGEEAVRRQIKAVKDALAYAAAAFSADSLFEAFTQVSDLSGGIKNAMIADPDALASALQEAVRGGSQEPLQALVLRYANVADDDEGQPS
jgi:AbiV family abortive infection protein